MTGQNVDVLDGSYIWLWPRILPEYTHTVVNEAHSENEAHN